MKAAVSVLLAALALCVPGTLLGQGWTGPAGVGIEVRDEAGQPIPGAAVVLAPGAGGDAPPFVFTDAGGRIEVRNLAEGEWQIEVRAAGYMIFNGYLRLVPGKPPEVGFSSRQRTGTFWQPLQVRFFAPGSPGDAVMVTATKEERKEEKKRIAEKGELEHQVKEGKNREAIREERRAKASTGEVAVLKEPPAPPPAPPPTPPPVVAEAPPPPPAVVPPPPAVVPPPAPPTRIAESAPPPAPAPPPRAAPPPPAPPPSSASPPSVAPPPVAPPAAAPPPAPPVAPPVAAPPPAPPRSAPAPPPAPPPSEPRVADAGTRPSPATPSEPSPARPAPAPAAPESSPARDASRPMPSIQARPVLFTGGACPECKPGEWALIVERRAAASPGGAAGVTSCGEGRDAAVGRLAREILAPAGAAVASFAGPVADSYGNGLPAAVQSVPADLAAALGPRDGACQDFAGVLPQGARFIGFRFEAEDASGKGDCFGEDPCSIGQARWSNNPKIERTSTVTVIHSSFANESTNAERRARMTLYFQPPRGWRPPA